MGQLVLGSVFALKPLYATFGVQHLHLTSEEGMANVADFDLQLFGKCASFEFIATGTNDIAGNVFGVNIFFHGCTFLITNHSYWQ